MVTAKKLKQKTIISEASNFENDLIKPHCRDTPNFKLRPLQISD